MIKITPSNNNKLLSRFSAREARAIDMIIKPTAEQIKELRKRMGWEQSDVAKILHLSSETMVSRYECGRRQMSAGFWELLCIHAMDQRYLVRKRHQEIKRHMHSRVYVSRLLHKEV